MEKTGRNDPCPCGSGKKFKQCCLSKKGGSGVKRKITAKWLNPKAEEAAEKAPQGVNLMDRAFSHATQSSEQTFSAILPKDKPQHENTNDEKEKKENL